MIDSEKGTAISPKMTICEVHRQIWDKVVLALADNPNAIKDIKPLMNQAMVLGMRLVQILIEHKLDLPDWERNNPEEASKLRLERIRITEEIKTYENP